MYSESQTSHLPRYPYPGLRPFAENEDSIFFGRDELIGELLRKVRDNRFVCVTGRSGCGKSSLVRTGMINKLHEGLLYGAGPNWVVVEMRPGGDPLGRLAKSLQESQILFLDALESTETEAVVKQLKKILAKSPHSLTKLIANAKFQGNTDFLATTPSSKAINLLLLVDQFEEIFRYRKEGSINHAEKFVSLILESARSSRVRINVVLTMRSDFIGDCALFNGLPEALNNAQFLVRPLSRVERKLAIEEPVQLYGAEVEPGLTNLILNDMEQLRFKEEMIERDGPIADQLPLMQHALLRTWQRALEIRRESQSKKTSESKHDESFKAQSREKIILIAEMYEEVGGVQRALHRHAEEAYRELVKRKDKTEEIAEAMFRLLTQRTEGQQDIRKPTKISVIAGVTGVDENEVKKVVKTFRRPDRSFIIPMIPHAEIEKYDSKEFVDSAKDLKSETFLDISHEALIRQWDTLHKWVKDEKDQVELYRRIEDDAKKWNVTMLNKPLLIGYQLKRAIEWQEKRSHNEAWAQHNFKIKGEEEQTSKSYCLVNDFIDDSRVWRRLRRVGYILISLIILIGIAVYWFDKEKQVAFKLAFRQTENDLLISRAKNLRRNQLDLKYLLAVEALSEGRKIGDEAGALYLLSSLLQKSLISKTIPAFSSAIEGPSRTFIQISVSRDGKIISSLDTSKLMLWDSSTSKQIPKLFDVSQITQSRSRNLPKDYLPNIAISADGNYLVTGDDGKFLIFDINVPKEPKELGGPVYEEINHSRGVRDIAFSPDGKIIATAGEDNQVILWKIEKKEAIRSLEGHNELARCVAFNKNGNILASGSYDKSIILWDVNTGKQLQKFDKGGHTEQLRSLAFSYDGTLLASAGADDKIILWDMANVPSGKKISELIKHEGDVRDVVFHPKENILVSCSNDRTIIIWDIKDPNKPIVKKQLKDSSSSLISLNFSPDGTFLASGDSKGTIRLWNFTEGKLINKTDTKTHSTIYDVVFTSNGQSIIAACWNGQISVWDIRDSQAKVELEKNQNEIKIASHIKAMDISPNGKWVAYGGEKIINVSKLPNLDKLDMNIRIQQDIYTRFAISPDSKWLTVGTESGEILIFDVKKRTIIGSTAVKSSSQKTNWISGLTYNKEGTIVAANRSRNEIILCNVPDGSILDTLRTSNRISQFVFSPSGKDVIAVGYDSGKIVLWNRCEVDCWYNNENEQLVGNHETKITALLFSADGQRLASCDRDGIIKIWNITEKKSSTTENKPKTEFSYLYSGSITDIVFIDQNILATADNHGKIIFWDINYGIPTGRQIVAHEGSELHLSTAQGSNELLIYSKNYFQRSPKTKIPRSKERLIDVAIADSVNIIAGASPGEITLWDLVKNEKTVSFPKLNFADFTSLAIIPGNSKLLVVGSKDGNLAIYNNESGELENQLITKHTMPVRGLAFNSAGDILATLFGPKTIKLWNVIGSDLSEYRATVPYNHDDSDIQKIAFQSDRNILAIADQKGRIFFWDFESVSHKFTLDTDIKLIRDIAFSRDGKFLAVAGKRGQVKIWQHKNGTWVNGKKFTPKSKSTVNSVAFSLDSNILIAGHTNGAISMWETSRPEKRPTYRRFHHNKILKIIFDFEGKHLLIASTSGELTLLKNTALKTFLAQSSDRNISDDHEQRIAISPDGKIEAVVDSEKSNNLILRSITTGETMAVFPDHTSKPRFAALNADGSTCLLADQDNKLFIWHIDTSGIHKESLSEPVSCIAISPDGTKFALGTISGYTHLYHITTTGTEKLDKLEDHQGAVSIIVFNDDGGLLATGGTDSAIRIWDIKNAPSKLRQLITGHQTPVRILAFNRESKRLASSDDDKKLYLWDIETGKKVADLTGHQDNVTSILFFNEGRSLASASFDNTVKIWDLDVDSWLRQACERANRKQLTSDEVDSYLKSKYSKRRESGCEQYLRLKPN